jgi:hypothetical protein
MKILHRKHTNKHKSARSFRKHAKRTKSPNMQKAPQRGGWRL